MKTFVYAAYLLQTIVTLVSFKFETSLLILHLAVVPGLHVVLLLHFNKQLFVACTPTCSLCMHLEQAFETVDKTMIQVSIKVHSLNLVLC